MLVGAAIKQHEQILLVDVMFIDGIPSLIGLATPLALTLSKSLLEFDSSKMSRSVSSLSYQPSLLGTSHPLSS